MQGRSARKLSTNDVARKRRFADHDMATESESNSITKRSAEDEATEDKSSSRRKRSAEDEATESESNSRRKRSADDSSPGVSSMSVGSLTGSGSRRKRSIDESSSLESISLSLSDSSST